MLIHILIIIFILSDNVTILECACNLIGGGVIKNRGNYSNFIKNQMIHKIILHLFKADTLKFYLKKISYPLPSRKNIVLMSKTHRRFCLQRPKHCKKKNCLVQMHRHQSPRLFLSLYKCLQLLTIVAHGVSYIPFRHISRIFRVIFYKGENLFKFNDEEFFFKKKIYFHVYKIVNEGNRKCCVYKLVVVYDL